MKRKGRVLLSILALLALLAGGAFYLYYRWSVKAGFNVGAERAEWLYIYPGATWNEVIDSLSVRMASPHAKDLSWLLNKRLGKDKAPTVGAYTVEPNMSTRTLYNRLAHGRQTPVRLSFNSVRLPSTLWRNMSRNILADSGSIAQAMTDTTLLRAIGVQDSTFAYRILPNTYEVYWNISPAELLQRMEREYQAFWTEERKTKAERIGLFPEEVVNLASIVQEESAKPDEYPRIAGLYLNRLRDGMLLQADPTVKYAWQDFGLRRILHKHLRIDSPYNTYKYTGLPPTPIRIPSITAIDSVLNAEEHTYIYMCAKSDFSGYHAFATTYAEHMRNARLYTKALNERGIK